MDSDLLSSSSENDFIQLKPDYKKEVRNQLNTEGQVSKLKQPKIPPVTIKTRVEATASK